MQEKKNNEVAKKAKAMQDKIDKQVLKDMKMLTKDEEKAAKLVTKQSKKAEATTPKSHIVILQCGKNICTQLREKVAELTTVESSQLTLPIRQSRGGRLIIPPQPFTYK